MEASYKKGDRALDFTTKYFPYEFRDIVFPLYISLVSPHVEFAVQLWSLNLRGDINNWNVLSTEQ